MPVSRLKRGREWELERAKTTCGYCGVGCQLEYASKDGEIAYAQAAEGDTVNGPFLCTKGRFGWDYATNPERLTQPMIRRDLAFSLGLTKEAWELPEASPLDISKPNVDDYFVAVDWDTALGAISSRLVEIVQESGPDAIMGLASARCTNEENYLFQKFMRAVIGTNNVDHCARL
jgi:predicted molibdopterin-dependent oxidoreductase YjgC